MTLALSAEQPPETVPDQSQTHVIVTVVTVDAVIVRVAERPDGSLALMPSGNRAPLLLDRYQKRALLEALMEGAA